MRGRSIHNCWNLDFPYDRIRASETFPVLLTTPQADERGQGTAEDFGKWEAQPEEGVGGRGG